MNRNLRSLISRLGVLVLLAALVSGCGWKHPTKGRARFEKDSGECLNQTRAARNEPPPESPLHMHPELEDRYNECMKKKGWKRGFIRPWAD